MLQTLFFKKASSNERVTHHSLPLRGGRWRRRRRMRAETSFRLPPITREAALFAATHLPTHQKLPCAATAARKAKKVFAPPAAVAVQGSSGRVREVWRVGSPFQGDSLRLQGLSSPPRSFSPSKVFPPLLPRTKPRDQRLGNADAVNGGACDAACVARTLAAGINAIVTERG